MERMKIDSIWALLEEESNGSRFHSEGFLKRIYLTECVSRFFLGVKLPHKLRCIIIELPYQLVDYTDLPQSKGYSLTAERVGDERTDYVSLILTTKSTEFNTVFTVLAEDICYALLDCSTYKEIYKSLIARLKKWQRFMDRFGPSCLSSESQLGLFGELYFLSNNVLNCLNPNQGLKSWTGVSDNSVHDFQFDQCSVEVKATAGKQPLKVHISNEMQLDNSLVPKLFLYHLSVFRTPGGDGMTLPELVSSIRDKIASDEYVLDLFNQDLFEFGYIEISAHLNVYEATKYVIRQENLYLVDESFPKVTGGDLPHGVGDLKYSITLSSCDGFKVPKNSFTSLLGEGRDG